LTGIVTKTPKSIETPPAKRPSLFRRPGAVLASVAVLAMLVSPLAAQKAGDPSQAQPGAWPAYGYDSGGTRHSPLTQITPENVEGLEVAWIYHMDPDRPETSVRSSTTTPIVADGRMYVGTPFGRVVALDPSTGRELWAYNLSGGDQPALRGLAYWPGNHEHSPRLIFGTANGNIVALDAATGAPAEGFGDEGVVDTKTPEIMNGFPEARYQYSAPPSIYQNVAIFGSRIQEAGARGPAGDVRAWNVITGELEWTFHSVPRPGELGHETWEGDSWRGRTGVNMWNMSTLDQDRGIAYLAFGAPTYDRYGGDRKGANLFSSSVVAVDAATGQYLWHFQTIHHDIWDYDQAAAPTLLTVRRDGRDIPAVAALSKTGLLFLLNRLNGEPLYNVTEVPVPPGTAPGEVAWPTQPVPDKPGPLIRMSFDVSELANISPEHTAACKALLERDGGGVGSKMFEPPRADRPSVRFPGGAGGPVWGGAVFDPRLGYFIFNTNQIGYLERIEQGEDGEWRHVGGRFWDRETRSPCQEPPWGELIAVNVNTGDVAWRSILGVSDHLPAGQQNTGRPGTGGPILTASGLLFIGATDDRRFRAFETATGKEIWSRQLDYAAHATPITYLGGDGRQYVTIVATGGSVLGTPMGGDSVVTFSLPTGGAAAPVVSSPRAEATVSPNPVPSVPRTSVPSSAAPAATPSKDLLSGEALVASSCSGCHARSIVSSQRKTREGWTETVYRMISFGLSLTDSEIERVVNYLTENHGAGEQH
jgi:quinoprotein glucose dehydrogenase